MKKLFFGGLLISSILCLTSCGSFEEVRATLEIHRKDGTEIKEEAGLKMLEKEREMFKKLKADEDSLSGFEYNRKDKKDTTTETLYHLFNKTIDYSITEFSIEEDKAMVFHLNAYTCYSSNNYTEGAYYILMDYSFNNYMLDGKSITGSRQIRMRTEAKAMDYLDSYYSYLENGYQKNKMERYYTDNIYLSMENDDEAISYSNGFVCYYGTNTMDSSMAIAKGMAHKLEALTNYKVVPLKEEAKVLLEFDFLETNYMPLLSLLASLIE